VAVAFIYYQMPAILYGRVYRLSAFPYDNSGLVAARGIKVIAEFPPLVYCSIWLNSRIPYSISRFTLGNFRNHFSRL